MRPMLPCLLVYGEICCVVVISVDIIMSIYAYFPQCSCKFSMDTDKCAYVDLTVSPCMYVCMSAYAY